MKNDANLTKIGVKYGLFLGLILVIISILIWLAGINTFASFALPILTFIVSLTLTIGFMRSGVIKYRTANDDEISFGTAFGIAGIIGLISLLLGVIWAYLQFVIIDTEGLNAMLDEAIDVFANLPNLTDEMIQIFVDKYESMRDPMVIVKQNFINGILGTLIYALLVAIFVKKDTREKSL